MDTIKITLAVLWICTMLNSLWGDVLNLVAGTTKPGEFMGVKATQGMLWGVAVLMVIPIVMVFLSLTLKYSVNRWANIIFAILLFGFNLIGLPTYPSVYDKFLIIVGLVFNVLTVWYAWKWRKIEA